MARSGSSGNGKFSPGAPGAAAAISKNVSKSTIARPSKPPIKRHVNAQRATIGVTVSSAP
jgi:hypothetical protein